MDDPLVRHFFTAPTQTLHKRYEILRAHFVEQRPLPTIAEQFGMNFYTVRALVRTFRAQCRANDVPPFSSNPYADDHHRILPVRCHGRRSHPPLLIAAK